MNVGDLINELGHFPQDALVALEAESEWGQHDVPPELEMILGRVYIHPPFAFLEGQEGTWYDAPYHDEPEYVDEPE